MILFLIIQMIKDDQRTFDSILFNFVSKNIIHILLETKSRGRCKGICYALDENFLPFILFSTLFLLCVSFFITFTQQKLKRKPVVGSLQGFEYKSVRLH